MDEETDILSVNIIPEFSDFLNALKIKNAGLGAQLFKAVYDHLFVASTDLRKEYDRYYCVEYPSLGEYLECAHDVSLEESELEKTYILKFKQDHGLMNQAYDDNILETVVDAIRKLEDENEN
ncbi:hypothetical protein [Rhizobium leguminosarum]|uniref:hypothetical protein n=1 Tax=Rhizobium leguminosarum TaxID=384 RepID=UPI00103CEF17|nr:hypothetical protein [Rhizobium leguminosarum]MBY5651782.1 hypothetical protein [Rhizobium leguminosarum]TBZ06261.1 hypothetical protein E0H38_33155 [Rhizobium leguminosarum bv. viciae]